MIISLLKSSWLERFSIRMPDITTLVSSNDTLSELARPQC